MFQCPVKNSRRYFITVSFTSIFKGFQKKKKKLNLRLVSPVTAIEDTDPLNIRYFITEHSLLLILGCFFLLLLLSFSSIPYQKRRKDEFCWKRAKLFSLLRTGLMEDLAAGRLGSRAAYEYAITTAWLQSVVTRVDGISRRKDRGRRVYSPNICFLKYRKDYVGLNHIQQFCF